MKLTDQHDTIDNLLKRTAQFRDRMFSAAIVSTQITAYKKPCGKMFIELPQNIDNNICVRVRNHIRQSHTERSSDVNRQYHSSEN